MPRKRHKPEEIVAKLRQFDVLVSPVKSAADCVREIGVTEVTYYRWRSKYGGMDSSMIAQMKALEDENRRLKKAAQEDVCRDEHAGRSAQRGPVKKIERPSNARQADARIRRKGQPREMAEKAVARTGVSTVLFGTLGPIGASAVVVQLRHLLTVFGFRP
jgi:putative transposase